jgi:hypothetical protein
VARQAGDVAVLEADDAGGMTPEAGRCMPAMVRMSEVLPAPLAPTMATMERSGTSSETLSSAWASPWKTSMSWTNSI